MFIPPPILRSTRWAIDVLISERDRRREFIRVYGKDRGLFEFTPSPHADSAKETVREIQRAAARYGLTFREVALAALPAR